MIGFGSAEVGVENSLEKEIQAHVKFKYAGAALDYYTEDFTKEMDGWIREMAVASRERAESYKNAETFPDRYSSYYACVVGDANYLCFIIKFSHTNRRHALSPDGWALLETERTFTVPAN